MNLLKIYLIGLFARDKLSLAFQVNMEGLIAVFYTNIWAMADLHESLKEYEDLEEQGKLLKEWIPVLSHLCPYHNPYILHYSLLRNRHYVPVQSYSYHLQSGIGGEFCVD